MLIMNIASVESGGPQNVEIRLRSLKQEKAIALEEPDERKILGSLTRFVENSDQSIPRIAALMGVSDAVLRCGWQGRLSRPRSSCSRSKYFLRNLALVPCDSSFGQLESQGMPVPD